MEDSLIMDTVWIILISVFSAGICTAAGVYLGIFLSERKKGKHRESVMQERDNRLEEARMKNLNDVYFELKDNIIILNDIRELIKNKKVDPAAGLLKRIKVERVFNLGRNIRMDRKGFEVMDRLYLSSLFKNKLGFFINLYLEDKLSLLELRAEVDKFIEELKTAEKEFKDIFIGVA